MMEGESHKQNGVLHNFSDLLELSASNDLNGFKFAIEEKGLDIDESCLWYGRRIGSKKMGFEERTPLLIASIFGCKDVVNYIVKSGRVDVNKACGSDGATALHCAVAGGSTHSPEVVKILLDASADANSVDSNGNRPGDFIASAFRNSNLNSRKKILQTLLKGDGCVGEREGLAAQVGNEMEGSGQQVDSVLRAWKDGNEKKDYPYDLPFPDIKSGMYGTDEFRMYTFKVQPCSRAYSHDWTECPFLHPGENARRRDPRKYFYSCVPCPEFRKGSCKQGDNCEYAHGIFESWLHPAQYRTRLCKDEANCTRRVCFFAHNQDELRPLYASTGSALPSPGSYGASVEYGSMSPLIPASPSVIKPSTSTPPLTPPGTSSISGGMWPNQSIFIPPTLQLPSSRLKAARSARGKNLNIEMSGELNRYGGVKPNNLEDIFGSLDTTKPPLQAMSLETASQLQSLTGVQMPPNINQKHRDSYPTNLASSPVLTSPTFGVESSGTTATSILSSKRTKGVIERPIANRGLGYSTPTSPVGVVPPNLSDWSSPDGKLDWGIQGEELNRLRKAASLVF
ncbi:Zinc finger CCCH domain-containing protein 66 [Hibiscus syriacus]|uniref:Zinc finger CCCH domain-containing protein 66 n=1 Tax=Hibiscus syriacus TaxID=106335 RepID=A0A6A2WR46_HIBSY|nr:zinc finger CCCH domain-containing protein 66-like [Hibiscus syriacus]KAE8663452.1 Zinc finger CCCH domain-containing protein 66 [Hibiscus syriacus]